MRHWYASFDKELSIEYLDWSDAPNAAVARSGDRFVIVTAPESKDAAQLLAKLVKK